MKLHHLLAALVLALLLPFGVCAEEAYPWQTGICPEACAVMDGPGDFFKEDGPKALLTSDMPVRVLGAEDGFVFIQYKLSDTSAPFGYVPEDALTVKAPPLDSAHRAAYTLPAGEAWPVTDDPLGEAAVIGTLIPGIDMAALFEIDGWTYVEDIHADGRFRAFIPRENMDYGRRFDLENWTQEAVSGPVILSEDGVCTADLVCDWADGTRTILLVDPLARDVRIILRADKQKDGHFRGTGLWPEGAYGADLIFLDAREIQVGEMTGFAW